MRKFNEICKELDDKEAQKLLEESYLPVSGKMPLRYEDRFPL